MKIINRFDKLVASVERFFLILFTGALVMILIAQVILRYGFSRPLFWAEEISVQLLVFLTLLGLSMLLRNRQMIAIEMIISALPPRMRNGLSILLQLLGLTIILIFAYEATLWIMRPEVRMEMSPTTGFPIWINYAMLPITLYGMAVHMGVALITMVFDSFKPEERQC